MTIATKALALAALVGAVGGCNARTSAGATPESSLCDGVVCTALDSCHLAGTCNPASGTCSRPAQPDGTPCGGGLSCAAGTCVAPAGSVLEHHNGPGRAGVYADATLTRSSAATFHVDTSFQAGVTGAIYAQPLYVAGPPGGTDLVIAATEQNNVAAFDAATGAAVWTRNLGTPVPLGSMPCGNIDPLGITGTPVADRAARRLYLDAMTTPDGGTTKRHLIFALSLDDGSTVAGWPVDVSAAVSFAGTTFGSTVQGQRGALALLGGTLYVPYGGLAGDCGNYRGWLVGIPVQNPSAPLAWATGARGGGIWGPSGVASDGTSVYVATGNTIGTSTWRGGEALLRFSPGPTFSGLAPDYFVPSNWLSVLDPDDADLGGTGPLVVDVPGATPATLLVALGKDGKIYLADRSSLGGLGGQVAVAQVATGAIINAAAAYATAQGTYVVFRGNGSDCPAGQSGDLTAVRITATSPPGVATAWCASQNGGGSPMVTTTDGRAESIVWSVGAGGDRRLHGFDGDTGEVVFGGGGAGDVLQNVQRFQTPILARGRIFVATDGGVVAFVR
jgi:hypothetical protein